MGLLVLNDRHSASSRPRASSLTRRKIAYSSEIAVPQWLLTMTPLFLIRQRQERGSECPLEEDRDARIRASGSSLCGGAAVQPAWPLAGLMLSMTLGAKRQFATADRRRFIVPARTRVVRVNTQQASGFG